MTTTWRPLLLIALTLAGCARNPKVAAVAPPPGVAAPLAAMPAGAHAGMIVPARLADGSYATPNRDLSQAASVWHLRAALNVAALACRGPAEATIVAGYNGLLRTQATGLRTAQATLAGEYRRSGGDWQDRYDDEMTRLYNFFSQSFARDAFCAAAIDTLAQSATLAPADLPAFATRTLPALDRPFTDFYRRYDDWRMAKALQPVVPTLPTPIIALDARLAVPAPEIMPRVTPRVPRIEVDPAVLQG